MNEVKYEEYEVVKTPSSDNAYIQQMPSFGEIYDLSLMLLIMLYYQGTWFQSRGDRIHKILNNTQNGIV